MNELKDILNLDKVCRICLCESNSNQLVKICDNNSLQYDQIMDVLRLFQVVEVICKVLFCYIST